MLDKHVKVVVFNQNRKYITNLKSRLFSDPDNVPIIYEETVAGFRSILAHRKPELALIELSGNSNPPGLDLLKWVSYEHSKVRTLVFAPNYRRVLESIKIGASSFVKIEDNDLLNIAVKMVRLQGFYLPLPAISYLMNEIQKMGDKDTLLSEYLDLTRRERQILNLKSQGMTYSKVGDTLGISTKTVQNLAESLRKKRGVSSINDLINRFKPVIPAEVASQ